jgi:hypothetical protein
MKKQQNDVKMFSDRLSIIIMDNSIAESDDCCVKIDDIINRGDEIEVKFRIDINEFPKFLNEDEAEILVDYIVNENSLDIENMLINCLDKINSESDIVSLKNKLSNHNRDILKKLVE